MAIGQARNEFVQRSKGQNICHKAAYIDRSRLEFEGTKFQHRKLYDYSNREAPLAKKIMLPEGADEKFLNPEILWNAAEEIEKQHNSQVGMELVIALPDDNVITEEDRIILTEIFSQKFVDKGLAAHYAIHSPDDKEDHNWHAHILVPTRTFSEDGESLHYLKDRSLQKEISNTRWGEIWTKIQNDYFKELGLDLRVDPKSLNPQEHLGAVRLRGNCLEMLERHAEIQKKNVIDASDPSKILKAISNEKAVWQVQDVERFMAKHTPHEKLEEVRDLFWKQIEIVKLQQKDLNSRYPCYKDIGKFTTKEVLEEEKQIVRRCEKINDIEHIKLKDKHLEKFSSYLRPEQLQAFKTLSGREGLYVLEGYAGTGKSHVLEALKKSYEAKGIRVRGFGPDNATANILKEKGFNAENVPRFLYAQEHGHREIKSKELWIVDEAGKLGNQALNELCRVAHAHKAKLILSGDSSQMPSVDRGGMFQALAEKYDASKLHSIQRQSSQEQRSITQSFAQGDIEAALRGLSKEKCLHFERDKASAMEKLIVDWSFSHYLDTSKSYEKSLILATTNREVHVLNQAAHDVRMVKGELKEQEYSCKTMFGCVRVSEGDLIEFRQNDRAIGVTNGLKGELVKAEEDRFVVKLDQEGKDSSKYTKIVSFDPKEYGSWQLGYATTTFRSQGRTVEDTYVLHNSLNGKQTSYVAMSRHKKTVSVYIDKEECGGFGQLQEQCSKDASKESTLYFHNEYDLQKQAEREKFDHGLEKAREYGTRWTRVKAFGRELKANIQEILDDRRENRADKSDSHDFYQNTSTEKSDLSQYGVSKLPEIEVYAIEKKSLKPIEKDMEHQLEELRIREAVLERQEMQLKKLAVYQEHCQSSGMETIQNIESLFTPENERSVVVLCQSQLEADESSRLNKEKGYVFVSMESRGSYENKMPVEDSLLFDKENNVDLSILEDRKLLVWGSELERLEILEQLAIHESIHARETEHDFLSSEASQDMQSQEVLGSWSDLEKQEKQLDVQLGIEQEEQQQRGFELSL
ncbi:AAA family ATPase [Candidatus Neptunichlamydia sp. REUL1]|uniref:AAA family ATPase n=1 Tax=Candidatus Neptunichlamydia sp. REUL1 TaxID=3064277 RepID=UPI0029304A11|nr:AAA family ATPase [Candidatus Neptunochlamydia sp. REUL1]